VRTASIRSARNERATQYCLVQDAATLAWAANLADLELHVPLHRAGNLDRPDSVVFDLDPGAPADLFVAAQLVAVWRGT
jgi:bifunctional non-homologous end joining protein LigD